jgi:uncharacterized protein YjhX (UPF0386 family)
MIGRSERLGDEQRRVLLALRQGCHLKVHRTVDGDKVCRLHCSPQEGCPNVEDLPLELVDALERGGFVQSNMKFPAAALLLTERGAKAAESLLAASPEGGLRPVGPRQY